MYGISGHVHGKKKKTIVLFCKKRWHGQQICASVFFFGTEKFVKNERHSQTITILHVL